MIGNCFRMVSVRDVSFTTAFFGLMIRVQSPNDILYGKKRQNIRRLGG
jgi:hypothetical protein